MISSHRHHPPPPLPSRLIYTLPSCSPSRGNIPSEIPPLQLSQSTQSLLDFISQSSQYFSNKSDIIQKEERLWELEYKCRRQQCQIQNLTLENAQLHTSCQANRTTDGTSADASNQETITYLQSKIAQLEAENKCLSELLLQSETSLNNNGLYMLSDVVDWLSQTRVDDSSEAASGGVAFIKENICEGFNSIADNEFLSDTMEVTDVDLTSDESDNETMYSTSPHLAHSYGSSSPASSNRSSSPAPLFSFSASNSPSDSLEKESSGIYASSSVIQKHRPAKRSRKNWSKDEDCLLISAIRRYGKSDWESISKEVGSRNKVQCKNRWFYTLSRKTDLTENVTETSYENEESMHKNPHVAKSDAARISKSTQSASQMRLNTLENAITFLEDPLSKSISGRHTGLNGPFFDPVHSTRPKRGRPKKSLVSGASSVDTSPAECLMESSSTSIRNYTTKQLKVTSDPPNVNKSKRLRASSVAVDSQLLDSAAGVHLQMKRGRPKRKVEKEYPTDLTKLPTSTSEMAVLSTQLSYTNRLRQTRNSLSTALGNQSSQTQAYNPRRGQWSSTEDELLIKGVKTHCRNWTLIAKEIKGRTNEQVRLRWRKLCFVVVERALGQPNISAAILDLVPSMSSLLEMPAQDVSQIALEILRGDAEGDREGGDIDLIKEEESHSPVNIQWQGNSNSEEVARNNEETTIEIDLDIDFSIPLQTANGLDTEITAAVSTDKDEESRHEFKNHSQKSTGSNFTTTSTSSSEGPVGDASYHASLLTSSQEHDEETVVLTEHSEYAFIPATNHVDDAMESGSEIEFAFPVVTTCEQTSGSTFPQELSFTNLDNLAIYRKGNSLTKASSLPIATLTPSPQELGTPLSSTSTVPPVICADEISASPESTWMSKPWTAQEDWRLIHGVYNYGLDWMNVSRCVEGRKVDECLRRWITYLADKVIAMDESCSNSPSYTPISPSLPLHEKSFIASNVLRSKTWNELQTLEMNEKIFGISADAIENYQKHLQTQQDLFQRCDKETTVSFPFGPEQRHSEQQETASRKRSYTDMRPSPSRSNIRINCDIARSQYDSPSSAQDKDLRNAVEKVVLTQSQYHGQGDYNNEHAMKKRLVDLRKAGPGC